MLGGSDLLCSFPMARGRSDDVCRCCRSSDSKPAYVRGFDFYHAAHGRKLRGSMGVFPVLPVRFFRIRARMYSPALNSVVVTVGNSIAAYSGNNSSSISFPAMRILSAICAAFLRDMALSEV